jgi:hypothetical protein
MLRKKSFDLTHEDFRSIYFLLNQNKLKSSEIGTCQMKIKREKYISECDWEVKFGSQVVGCGKY